MTREDLIRLAKNCREAQNRFFRGGRTQEQKEAAQQIEKHLDRELAVWPGKGDPFVAIARNCRTAQNRWFREQSRDNLSAAKDWERRVDTAIHVELHPPQAGLFDDSSSGEGSTV